MNKKFTLNILFILAIILCAAFANHVSAQTTTTTIVNYDFNAPTLTTTPCSATPVTATGVTSTFSTSPANCAAVTGTVTTAAAFTQNTTAGTAPNLTVPTGTTNFFQFQISGTSNYSNFMVYFQTQRSNSGPNSGTLQYSLDGTTFTTFGSAFAIPTAFGAFNFDLSTITALNNQPTVYFRIVGTGSTGGTNRIDNFQVQATAPSAPTAATVTIGGRAINSSGRALARTRVSMTDSAGNVRTATTNLSGYYRFANVEVGQTLILTARNKGYSFTEPTKVVSLNDEQMNINFTAYPSNDSVK